MQVVRRTYSCGGLRCGPISQRKRLALASRPRGNCGQDQVRCPHRCGDPRSRRWPTRSEWCTRQALDLKTATVLQTATPLPLLENTSSTNSSDRRSSTDEAWVRFGMEDESTSRVRSTPTIVYLIGRFLRGRSSADILLPSIFGSETSS